MEQLHAANAGRAATCRGPWQRTLGFPAPYIRHLKQRSVVLANHSGCETTVSLAVQAQLRQQQLRQSGAVDVSFIINYSAEYGQQVVLVGSCQELGSWDTAAAVRLTWQQGDNWKAAVQLPAPQDSDVELEYKYAIISKDGSVDIWQEGPNISLVLSPKPATAPQPQPPNFKVFDSWLQPQHSQHVLAVQQQPAAAEPVAVPPGSNGKQGDVQMPLLQQPDPSKAPPASSRGSLAEEKQQVQPQMLQRMQHSAPQLELGDQHEQVQKQQPVYVSSDSSSARHSSSSSANSGITSSISSPSGSSNHNGHSSSSSNSKSAAASWADAASLLAKVAAAATSAAAAAGNSLAAAASDAAASASATAAGASAPEVAPAGSQSKSTSSSPGTDAAAVAGNAVVQLLTAVVAGVVTIKKGAANNRMPGANSSGGTPALGATGFVVSEEAMSQASAAMVKSWRGLLAAAAKAQRRAKIAARNSSMSVNAAPAAPVASCAVTADEDAAATVGAASASAMHARDNSLGTTGVRDLPQSASAAAAAVDSEHTSGDSKLQSVQVPASALQQQQQQQQQQLPASAAVVDEVQSQPLQVPAHSGAANKQQQALDGAPVAAEPQEQPVAACAAAAEHESAQVLAAAVEAGTQQLQQLEVNDSVPGAFEPQDEESGTFVSADDQQQQKQQEQHLLAPALQSEDHHHDQQQQQEQQVLAQVMHALEHSASLRQESGDPCDPGLLAADRRLAAAADVFRSLANSPEPDSLQEEQQQQERLQEVNV